MIKSNHMLYLVGGVPRSGKTQLQKYLLENYKVPGISLDDIRAGFREGLPEFGINDNLTELDKSAKLWMYIKGLIYSRDGYLEDDHLLIEGTNLLPILLSQFKDHPNVKVCFLGYSEITAKEKQRQVKQFPRKAKYTEDSDLKVLEKHIIRSKQIKTECELYGIKYFDTSINFNEIINKAAEFLIDKN